MLMYLNGNILGRKNCQCATYMRWDMTELGALDALWQVRVDGKNLQISRNIRSYIYTHLTEW